MRIYCNGKSWEIKISNIHFDGEKIKNERVKS